MIDMPIMMASRTNVSKRLRKRMVHTVNYNAAQLCQVSRLSFAFL